MSEKNIRRKIYLVTCGAGRSYYVVAKDYGEAEELTMKYLEERKIGYSDDRRVVKIAYIAISTIHDSAGVVFE